MSVISNYYLLRPNPDKLIRFSECDFNISGDSKLKKEGSNIPLSLKEKTEAYLILFYYNSTETEFLRNWETISSTELKPLPGNDEDLIKYGFVNLDLEKNLLKTFNTLPVSNPFRWAKKNKLNRDYFILFYYKTFPQYYYKGYINSYLINNEFEGWRTKLGNAEDEKGKKFKTLSNKYLGDGSIYQVIKEFEIVNKENNTRFTFKVGDLYEVSKGDDYNYRMVKKFNKEVVFSNQMYDFDTNFKQVIQDKSVPKKNIYLDNQFFKSKNGGDDDFKNLFKNISGRDV